MILHTPLWISYYLSMQLHRGELPPLHWICMAETVIAHCKVCTTGRVSGKTRPPQTSCVFKYFARVLQLVWLLHLKASFVKRTQCPAFMYNTAVHVFVTRPCGVKLAVQITLNSDPCNTMHPIHKSRNCFRTFQT